MTLNEFMNNLLKALRKMLAGNQLHYKYSTPYIDDDQTYFFVNAADAKDDLPNVTDLTFLVSLVNQALTSDKFNSQREIDQFMIDFARHNKIFDNGKDISKKNTGLRQLTMWSKEIAKHTHLPEDKVMAAIATLNQTVGNSALGALRSFNGQKLGEDLAYRTLQDSIYFQQYMARNKQSLTYFYALPLQTFSASDPSDDLEKFDPNSPDLILRVQLKIDFDNYFTIVENSDDQSEISINPDVVTHTISLEQRNKNIHFQFDSCAKYSNRDMEDFDLIPDGNMLDPNQDWVVVKPAKLAIKS